MRLSRCTARLCAILLASTPAGALAQLPGLDELLSGGDRAGGGEAAAGGLGALLESLQGADEGSLRDAIGKGMPSGLPAGADMLGDLFGDIGGETLPTRAPTAAEMELALTCRASIGNPLFEPIIDQIANAPFGGMGGDLGMAQQLLGAIRAMAGSDPCVLRDLLILESLVGAFGGEFTVARDTLAKLLPPLGAAPSGLLLLGHLAQTSILMLQRREEEADAAYAELAPHVTARFGTNSRLALAVDAARIDIVLGMADTARAEGRETRARALYAEAVDRYAAFRDRASEIIGPGDELVCMSLIAVGRGNLRLGRRPEAEALLRRALEQDDDCRRIFGPDNLWTALARYDLGLVLLDSGDLAAADAELGAALDLVERQRGTTHPYAVQIMQALAELRVLQGRTDAALDLVDAMSDGMLTWLGGELRTTSSNAQRRRVAALQSGHQDLALLIALARPEDARAQRAAATAVLRYKGMQGEEDALLQRLARQSEDPRTAELAQEVGRLQSALATAYTAETGGMAGVPLGTVERIGADLAAAEADLQRRSGQFRRQLEVRSADAAAVAARLAVTGRASALVEYRLIRRRPLGALDTGDAPKSWAAVVLRPEGAQVVDLGPAGPIQAQVEQTYRPDFLRALFTGAAGPRAMQQRMLAQIYQLILAPLEIADAQQVFIAPEGTLNLVPFLALRSPDGALWATGVSRRVTLVPSGRVLLGSPKMDPGDGMIVIGDVAYGKAGEGRFAFKDLPETKKEVEALVGMAETAGLPVQPYVGEEAKEAVLTGLRAPPRILHLATHGFYHDAGEVPDRPSVLAGVALANANLPPPTTGDDGILYAIEVQSLHLEGTLLAALSACETALGFVERGEALHGMGRAFRVAGARYALVALRNVPDLDASLFVESFYGHLFANEPLDPEAAFAATITEMVNAEKLTDWTGFTLLRNW